MRKALIVDCCLRGVESRTAKLRDAFVAALPEDVQAETLVLEEEALSCLTGAHFAQRQRLRNLQPGGGLMGLVTSPSRMILSGCAVGSGMGMAESSAFV